MAIGSITVEWLARLHARQVFPKRASVFDLGPQDVNTTRAVVESTARRLHGENGPPMVDEIFHGEMWRRNAQLPFYRMFGAETYQSVDLADTRAGLAWDLNKPIKRLSPFDVITDFGTSEHVFNIGQVFASIHRLLAEGGIVLFQSPTFGFINHGFFNLHPIVFSEFAAANRYEVVDFVYVDNFYVRDRKQERTPDRPFNFDDLPINVSDAHDLQRFMADVALRFKNNLSDPDSSELTLGQLCFVFDLVLVALRKTARSPKEFINPHQGGFGPERRRTSLLRRIARKVRDAQAFQADARARMGANRNRIAGSETLIDYIATNGTAAMVGRSSDGHIAEYDLSACGPRGEHYVNIPGIGLTPGLYTLSMQVRPRGGHWLRLQLLDSANDGAVGNYELSQMTTSFSAVGRGSKVNATITKAGEWSDLSLTCVFTQRTAQVIIQLLGEHGTNGFVASEESLVIRAIQLEDGGSVTSYQPNFG